MTTTTVTDLYPSRGATEVSTPRKDPVVWSAPGAPGPIATGELEAFERDGFLPLDQIIGPDQVPLYQRVAGA